MKKDSIAIYTLTSPLHDEQAVNEVTKEFLGSLGLTDGQLPLSDNACWRGNDYGDYGESALSLIYVRTGGTEGFFKTLLPQLQAKSREPFYLLTSGKSNSLAASMEILSYLRQLGLRGEILHGSAPYIKMRMEQLVRVSEARRWLRGKRLGIVGCPSDWLISSNYDVQRVAETLGVELVDIEMEEVIKEFEDQRSKFKAQGSRSNAQGAMADFIAPLHAADKEAVGKSLPDALHLYMALKTILQRHDLQGFTIRCFDLLTSIHNTGCVALAQLNSEGYVAGCEGDVPTMLSMLIVRALTGQSGFQANPAHINVETGEMLFAHCTIPLQMTHRFELDTHFESGIGVGVRGYVKEGPVTVFKTSGLLDRCFIAEGMLTGCGREGDLCRTQLHVRLDDARQATYFLNNPIGNHHVIVEGRLKAVLEEMLGER